MLAAEHDPCDLLVYGEQPDTLKAAIARAIRGREPESRTLPLPVSMRFGISGLLNPNTRRLSGFLPTGVVSGEEIRGLTHEAASTGWPTRCELWLTPATRSPAVMSPLGAAARQRFRSPTPSPRPARSPATTVR